MPLDLHHRRHQHGYLSTTTPKSGKTEVTAGGRDSPEVGGEEQQAPEVPASVFGGLDASGVGHGLMNARGLTNGLTAHDIKRGLANGTIRTMQDGKGVLSFHQHLVKQLVPEPQTDHPARK